MSITEILYMILIMPLQLFFEVVYAATNRAVHNPGLAIIGLSLVMNLLILPLYKRADALQEEERDIEAKLAEGVAHIKKNFKGDEKMMLLQTYYRQNNYNPLDVFKSSLSLFLEIPFFIAAYNFLSHLELLQGAKFGIIKDLGAPDALLTLGDMSINVLPFVMTAINIISCIIFTKGYPLKTKVQLYSMALFFLVFLYKSPAGLVFYWTLNNTFNLVKTIFYKLKHPRTIICYILAVVGAGCIILGCLNYIHVPKKLIRYLLVGCLLLVPAILLKLSFRPKLGRRIEANSKIFITSALFLVVLIGLFIPLTVLKASPQEFINSSHFFNPLWFANSSFCLALGAFGIWLGVFYWLAGKNYRGYYDLAILGFSSVAIVDFMLFNKSFGSLNSILQYEKELDFTIAEKLTNGAAVLLALLIAWLLHKYCQRFVVQLFAVGTVALMGMSLANIKYINDQLSNLPANGKNSSKPYFTLSRTGKNVVLIMLDRAVNAYIPYMFNEKPELKSMYAGFTHYNNVISFGPTTNVSAPSLFGGYEYTPENLNKRDKELLVDKHNEALKVLPVMFNDNNFAVTVMDPVYAGYQWIPDLSIYNDYPKINKYITNGAFAAKGRIKAEENSNKRNFIFYSMMKVMPSCLQKGFYDEGNYNSLSELALYYVGQKADNIYAAKGIRPEFYKSFAVLENMINMTNISSSEQNTFLMITNDATHSPMLLQLPDYKMSITVDNNKYEGQTRTKQSANGQAVNIDGLLQQQHYHVNMASLLEIGKWLDFLKQEGVYDNTKIIIASDHTYFLRPFKDLIYKDYDLATFYPLLLVKDFKAQKLTTCEEFTTLADVPVLATKDVIEKPINPFTGNPLNDSSKKQQEQHILFDTDWHVTVNNGKRFIPGRWLSVHEDMRKLNNWQYIKDPSL